MKVDGANISNDYEVHRVDGDSMIRQRHPPIKSSMPQSEAQKNGVIPRYPLMFMVIAFVGVIFLISLRPYTQTLFEEIFEGHIPEKEISDLSQYRAIIRDLAVVMRKSDVIVKNGKPISEVLTELDDDIRDCSMELGEFDHQAKKFIWLISSEMNDISREMEKSRLFRNNKFIHERLWELEKRTPAFQEQLKRVIKTIITVQDSASHVKGHLIDGEREAESALREHWVGAIADYSLRKTVEKELIQVRYIIKALKDVAPNLFEFENFLNEYRRRIQDVKKEAMGVPKDPREEDIRFLKQAVFDLEDQQKKFSSARKQLGRKPLDEFNFEEKWNSANRDCAEFRALLEKPGAHLINLRIWASDMVNAIGFFYSDSTSDIYGLPGDGEPQDIKWDKGEKIKNINIRIGAVLYAIRFETDRGRVSNWYGGSKGNEYVVLSGGSAIGIHGSFSRQICSVGIIV